MGLFWYKLKRKLGSCFRRFGHFIDYLQEGEGVFVAWEHSGRVAS